MEKTNKKDIYEAGQNDTYVEDILLESAQKYIDENTEGLTEGEKEEAIDIYRDGFLGN